MNVEAIFKELAESQLLNALSNRGKLLFVGEEETVDYLQRFYEQQKQPCQHSYLCWTNDENLLPTHSLLKYDAVVIASVKNEHKVFEDFNHYLHQNKQTFPVYKLFSDIFVNLQAKRSFLQLSGSQITPPKIAYAILSTPRSGSTLLCNALMSTRIAGFPKEHLRPPSQVLATHCQFDYVRYLKVLMTYQVTQNRVFGTKFIAQFLEEHLKTPFDFESIIDSYKFIYLYRKDKLSQAISIWMAQKTGVWYVQTRKNLHGFQTKTKNIKIEDVDLEEIDFFNNLLHGQENSLQEFFERYQISPLKVEYEQFIKFPEENLSKILNCLGIIADKQPVKLVNQYEYKLFQLLQNLNLVNHRQVFFKLRDKKVESTIKKEAIRLYKQQYG